MSDEKWRWPKRIIPYTIGAEYSAGRKKMIQGAMQEWMDRTCIVFAEKGSAKAKEAGFLIESWREKPLQRAKISKKSAPLFFQAIHTRSTLEAILDATPMWDIKVNHCGSINVNVRCLLLRKQLNSWTFLSPTGKDHPVSLQLGSCTVHRIVLHELGHTIGNMTINHSINLLRRSLTTIVLAIV